MGSREKQATVCGEHGSPQTRGGPLSPSPRALTSADLNQDGYGDLVVGAPGYSRPGHPQVGRVYLLYGNELGLPPIDLDLDREAHVTLEGFQVRCPSPGPSSRVRAPRSSEQAASAEGDGSSRAGGLPLWTPVLCLKASCPHWNVGPYLP